jgi:hypothetical protein
LIGKYCRSRSSLPNPSKRSKNHRKERERKQALRGSTMEVRKMLKNDLELKKPLGKKSLL